ncbi:serine/threonine protein kinase [Thermococcus profundus]|uniref:Serine/threonine protein kinase n=1 Tax=Thermococcus profundus TaxID=49899 RepID=A0A2Z2M8X2_THEPR|nr:serine/threonine protein kinase [Thermococcus profundus]ASJ01799.1 serine/threonine protein kinase [Thermococcus profundus]
MFEHLIPGAVLEEFSKDLERIGVGELSPLSKGTTSVVFRAKMGEKNVIIKLQRPDSPRSNFAREADIIRALEPFGITPPLVAYGKFGSLEYIIREFAEGEIILHADLKKRHLFEIVEKTALLDRLGLDHGQIQGGKHIIVGDRIFLIDFEKANWRKPKNLTSAVAMIFLSDNTISKRVREKFGIDVDFLERMKKEVRVYKNTGKVSGLLRVLSSL